MQPQIVHPMRIIVILNSAAGSVSRAKREAFRQELGQVFQKLRVASEVRYVHPDELIDFTKGIHSKFDAVIAAGGDGTVSSIARVLAKTGKPMGILPMGTFNHFAKDLKIPLKLDDAARVIAAGYMKDVDLGEVNGRIFINNSSIGLYPQVVKERNEEWLRLGRNKWLAMASAAIRVFRRFPIYSIHIETPERSLKRTTPFLFIGNNRYEISFFRIGKRESLKEGIISLYLLKKTDRFALVKVLFTAIFGHLNQERDFDLMFLTEARVETRRRRVTVAADGELLSLEPPLYYRSCPKALKMIVPEA